MAVSSESQFSFAKVGVPTLPSEFNPFESTTNPKRMIGFKVEDVQGNVYRWAHFGAAVTPGLLVAQDISESSVVDTDNAIISPASAVTTTDGTIGSRYVELTLASATADQYAGGTFVTTDDTGEGYTYRIVGNTATGTPASGNIRLELDKGLQVAVDNTTDFAIYGSRYANLEAATFSTDVDACGVSMGNQAAADYGWVLTKGIVGILGDGNGGTLDLPQIGKGIIIGSVAGSAQVATATNDNVLGVCLVAPDDTGYGIFKINCE